MITIEGFEVRRKAAIAQELRQRRERMATEIIAGIYAGINANQPHSEICAKTAALCAVSGADALIKALEAAERADK